MGASEIDSLEIGIEAQAAKANKALDALVSKLDKLSSSVGKVNGSDLVGFANGIEKICKASSGMSNIKTSDFTRLSKNIQNIASINTAKLNVTSSALGMMSKQLSSFGAVATNADGIGEIAKNISKLGNKGVISAIDNMPRFATALSQMMTTLSKAPQMSKNLVEMTNALANLSNSLKGTQSTVSKFGSGVNGFSKAFSGITESTNRGARSLKSFSQIAGSFYVNFFMVTRGVQKAWNSVMSSMDYVETFNYWNVALDKIGTEFSSQFEQYGYDSAESYANSFSNRIKNLTLKMTGYQIGDSGDLSLTGNKNLGLDPEQLMNYQAKIDSVTNAVGLCGETSTNTAKALSMLSADMSSFTNTDLSTVMTNFQSGLIGQSRALYKYGIDITNATLQTYAYKYGITKAMSEMTQAEKMQLRLIAILDQSKVAWGDQANTLNSVANQYRITKQQISNLARTLGNLFLPIVKNVLPVINAMVMSLNRLFTTLGFHFFGSEWLKELQDGTSKGFTGIEDLGDEADDVSNGLNEVANAAKKLKNATLGIDELNIINPNTDSGYSGNESGAGSSIDLSDAISEALKDYETVWDKAFAESENKAQQIADAICGAFQRGDYEGIGTYISNGISSALEKINWESVYGVANNFGTGLAQFLNGLITPELFGNVGTTIAGALNTAIYTSLSFGATFDFTNFGESLATGINNFFSTFDFASAAENVNTWVQGLYETIKTAIANIDWWDVYSGIKEFLSNLDISTVAIIIGALTIKKIGSVIFGAHIFKAIASAIGGSLSSSIAAVMASKLGLDLAEGAGMSSAFLALGRSMGTTFIAGFQALFGSEAAASELAFINPIVVSITGIASAIGGAVLAVSSFFEMWENGWSILGEILKDLGIVLTAVGAVILGIATGPIAAIVAAVVAAVSTIAIVVHDNWGAICEWFSGAAEWFDTNVITPITEFFKGLWEKVSGFFSNLWSDIVGIWQFVSGWFNEHVISPVVGFFKGLWEKVSGFFSKLWSDICTVWQFVSGWFNEHVITPVVGFFQGVWEKVSGFFSKLWSDIKGIWASVASWFDENVIQPLVGFFDGLWSGIKAGMVGAMNAIIGGIESGINFIVGGINSIISGFNGIVSWAAKVADIDWDGVDLVPTVSLTRISAFETGGFPETGQLFMARENGINEMVGRIGNRNTVANNDQIVESVSIGVSKGVADAVEQALAPYLTQIAQNTRETADKDTSINISDKDIARASIRGQRAMGMQLRTT